METKEIGVEEIKLIFPQPTNRHILVEYPISPSKFKVLSGILELSPKAKEEAIQEELRKLFPDGTMKYKIVAKSKDCNEIYNLGDYVSLSKGGKDRPHEFVASSDYMLISEGDIALIWNAEALESNRLHYGAKTGK